MHNEHIWLLFPWQYIQTSEEAAALTWQCIENFILHRDNITVTIKLSLPFCFATFTWLRITTKILPLCYPKFLYFLFAITLHLKIEQREHLISFLLFLHQWCTFLKDFQSTILPFCINSLPQRYIKARPCSGHKNSLLQEFV